MTNITNHTGWGGSPVSASYGSQERRLGFPGKYHSMQVVTAGSTGSFTGSNFGFGAVLIGEGASVANSHINVAGGERITGDNLAKEVIYDITPETVVANSGNIYVFKVQGH